MHFPRRRRIRSATGVDHENRICPDPAIEERLARLLLDVLIRAGLVLALVMLCYRVFSPFLVPMV